MHYISYLKKNTLKPVFPNFLFCPCLTAYNHLIYWYPMINIDIPCCIEATSPYLAEMLKFNFPYIYLFSIWQTASVKSSQKRSFWYLTTRINKNFYRLWEETSILEFLNTYVNIWFKCIFPWYILQNKTCMLSNIIDYYKSSNIRKQFQRCDF